MLLLQMHITHTHTLHSGVLDHRKICAVPLDYIFLVVWGIHNPGDQAPKGRQVVMSSVIDQVLLISTLSPPSEDGDRHCI